MVVLDATIVNIALPSAQRALHFSTDNRQWVITAYALAFGSLLLLGGKLGDLFGRKWTLIGGLTGFARRLGDRRPRPSFGMLVGGPRAAGSLRRDPRPVGARPAHRDLPGTLRTGPRRSGSSARSPPAARPSGLLLGGVLTQTISWRWCLYVNLLIAVPTAIVAFRLLRNERQPARPRIDLPGTLRRLGRPVRARLRLLQRRDALVVAPVTIVALAVSAVLLDRLRGARAPRRASAAAAAHRVGPGPRRRLRDDRPGRLGRVRGLPVPHLLPAAEPRLLAAEDRARPSCR